MPEPLHGEVPAVHEFPGLCRICGRPVLPPNDPNSCAETICSERCLGEALVAYWAAQGIRVTVMMREGYARLESVPGVLSVHEWSVPTAAEEGPRPQSPGRVLQEKGRRG